jgi:hypothetical protein
VSPDDTAVRPTPHEGFAPPFVPHALTSHSRRKGLAQSITNYVGSAPNELASYCIHALDAASELPSRAAIRRLVKVALSGLARGAA